MRVVRRLGAGVVCAVVALAGLMVPGSAAPTWLPVVTDLSVAGQDARGPQIVVDGAGNATAVWYRSNGSSSIVQSSFRPHGGVWSAPVDLSAAGQNAYGQQVAVDPEGNVTAVWSRSNGTDYIVQSAFRPVGGVWSAPVDLSAAGQNAGDPQVAVDPEGKVTAVWSRFNGAHWIIQSASRPAGGVWSTPFDVSAAGLSAHSVQIAVDASGNATAVWSRLAGSYRIVQSASRPVGGAWSTPVDLTASGQDAFGPMVAVDASGNATAVWRRSNGTHQIVQSASRPAGGVWSASFDVSAPGQDAESPQVVVDGAGNATAVWSRFNGTKWVVQVASRPVGAGWEAPSGLSTSGQNGRTPQVGVDAAGTATVVWDLSDGATDVIQAARRPRGGAGRGVVDVSGTGRFAAVPDVVVTAGGDAVAVWERSNGTNRIVQSRTLDVAGPTVSGLSASATGQTGQSLSYSVTAADAWSDPSTVSWNFGDGTPAVTGASVTHSYAAAGTYEVTVTATDAVGNTTVQSATTTITTPVVPPTPAPTTPAPTTPAPTTAPPPVAPRITRFAVSKKKISRSRKPKATRATITVSAAAKVRLVITRKGNRKGKGKSTKVATVVRSLKAGKNTFKLTARISGKKRLTPGRYVITAIATNAAGTSTPKKVKLRIVR